MREEFSIWRDQQEWDGSTAPAGPDAVLELSSQAIELLDADGIIGWKFR